MPHHIKQNPNGPKESVSLIQKGVTQENNVNSLNMQSANHYGALSQFTGNRYDGHISHSFAKEKNGVVLHARSHHDFQGFPHDREPRPQLNQARDFAHHENLIKKSRSNTMMYTVDDYHAEHYPYGTNNRIHSQHHGQRLQRIMSDPHFRHYQDRQPLTRYFEPPLHEHGPGPRQDTQPRGSHNASAIVSSIQSAAIEQAPVSSPRSRRDPPPHSPKQIEHASNRTNDEKKDSAPSSCSRSEDINDGKELQSIDRNAAKQLNANSEKRLPPKKREERLSKTSSAGEEKKESNDSQEKELVNGALLALVSLAQRPAPASSCAQRPSRRSSSSSLTSIRENEIQTPPPQVETLVSNTITPSSSAATMQAFMAQQPSHSSSNSTCVKDNLSSFSDDSNPRSDRPVTSRRLQSSTLSERSAEHNTNPSHVLPPKHPLTLPETSHDMRRGNPPPPFPLPSRGNIPVPRLDRDRMESTTPGYTLTMRKDADAHFDRDSTYNAHPRQYVTTDESCVHEARRMSVHGARPRFYSTPIEYTRQGYHEYDRLSDYPPQSLPHERSHPRHYGLETRGSFDDGRMGGVVGQRNRVASRDDCEERGHQYHIARTHFPEEAYYSPSPHYLPLHKRQPSGPMYHPTPSQSMPRMGHFIHHPPPPHRVHSQEVRIQFECPDSRGSRKEPTSAPLSCVSSFEDYPPSPYQMPVYHNRLPEGHPQGQMGVKKTILRRKCAWKNYPELEKFLIENREDYLKHSAKNYTIEQKQYNNRLTERLLEVAAKHNYVFDPNDFNFVAVRDRIRCYYKSYVQTNKKRGVEVGYDATGAKKKKKLNKVEDNSEKDASEQKEKAPNQESTEESKIVDGKQPEEK